jgi:hypothetical protein
VTGARDERYRYPILNMVLHIYHCNRLTARDKRRSVGRNRPGSITRYPSRPGGADIDYPPPVDGFANEQLATLLSLFQFAPLGTDESPVTINWPYLEQRLGKTQSEIASLIEEASRLRLLRGVTIAYDHERWMEESSDKGCLLVMACIELIDLDRTEAELYDAFCRAVIAIRDGIVGEQDTLDTVFVMPNVHLGPRLVLATDSEAVVGLIQGATRALEQHGFRAHMNSFGYSKMLDFSINAHPMGYVLRVV